MSSTKLLKPIKSIEELKDDALFNHTNQSKEADVQYQFAPPINKFKLNEADQNLLLATSAQLMLEL